MERGNYSIFYPLHCIKILVYSITEDLYYTLDTGLTAEVKTTHFQVNSTGVHGMLGVLVVDDDADMRLLIRRLVTMLGCQSFEARNGIEAETIAANTTPDAILLDIMMPVQDGYETCAKLRAQGYTGTVIMVSALQEQTQIERAREVGANAYIQKPITREVLRMHLDRLKSQQTA